MASRQAISTALKLLSRAFAGVVDQTRVEVYGAALEDLSDEEIATATALVIKTHTGEFIPPPAVLRKAVAPAPVAVDAEAIVRRIEKLATYNPNRGMVPPAVSTVEERLGPTVAYAYAAAGGPSLFAENDVGRSIALREFQRAMTEAASRPGIALPVFDARALPPTKDPKIAALITETAEALAADDRRNAFVVHAPGGVS